MLPRTTRVQSHYPLALVNLAEPRNQGMAGGIANLQPEIAVPARRPLAL